MTSGNGVAILLTLNPLLLTAYDVVGVRGEAESVVYYLLKTLKVTTNIIDN